jgi:hypothetical protein
LVELLVVLLIVPVIAGAIGFAIFSAFSVQKNVTGSVNASGNLQEMSSTFYKDVASAIKMTTDPNAPQCGTGTQLVGMEWKLDGGQYDNVVSYSLMTSPGSSTDTLVRELCSLGSNPTPTTTTVVSGNISPQQAPPIVSPTALAALTSQGWVSSNGITNVQLSVIEPSSGVHYALDSVPQLSNSSVQATPPGSPGSATEVVTSNGVTVSWTAPTANGGIPVSNYEVTATDSTTPSNGGEACSATAPTTSCTVTGLTYGDTYTFSVVAVNGAGSSNPDSTSLITLTAAPSTVASLSATGPNNVTQFTESWSAPAANGKPITGYSVRYSTNGSTWTTACSTATTSCTINAPSQTTYYVQVSATNSVGSSPWSASDTVSWATTTSYQTPVYGYSCPSGGTLDGNDNCDSSSSYAAVYTQTSATPIYTYELISTTPIYTYEVVSTYYYCPGGWSGPSGSTCWRYMVNPPYSYLTTGANVGYNYGYVQTGTTYNYGYVQTGTTYTYAYECPSGGTLDGNNNCDTYSSYAATYGVTSDPTYWNYAFQG